MDTVEDKLQLPLTAHPEKRVGMFLVYLFQPVLDFQRIPILPQPLVFLVLPEEETDAMLSHS
jgi:hypothetical protein